MMFGMMHEGKKVTKTLEISLKEERDLVIREIQAFAGDYAHPMTQDGVTRDVLIVEDLLDFLRA
jgi:hypothetical protein